ncbi:unnamed protein product [Colias eurytheme]|nr:unnamed protein product [Colias eurytheme]
MDSEVVRGKPLTKDETKLLLGLIESSSIILSKTTNAASNKMKNEEWVSLTHKFNATASVCRRSPQQLRLKWENLKKLARKRSTKIRMNRIQTGGGIPEYIPPDDILDRVADLLGSTASGFVVPFGKKKLKSTDGSSSARNLAIAEYYTAKKQCLDAKKEFILLQNEKLKLEIEKLRGGK